MMTLPLMYERYESEVNYLASKGNEDLRRLLMALDSKVFNKIPRGPVKEKKYKWTSYIYIYIHMHWSDIHVHWKI